MGRVVRANATKHERYLVSLAAGIGLLATVGGVLLAALGVPLAGALGGFALALAALYLVPAAVFARRRSRVAWGVLMVVFAAVFATSATSLTPQGLLAGGAGLYVGYRAAEEGGYDLPVVGRAGV